MFINFYMKAKLLDETRFRNEQVKSKRFAPNFI